MAGQVMNLFVMVAAGVILADLVHNWQGTATLFNGVGGLWRTSVNGMLGSPS